MKKPERPKFGGRKKGTPNKFNSVRVDEAKRRNLTLPHEGLLMLFNNLLALCAKYQPTAQNPNANEKQYRELMQEAGLIGKAAAPYYAPKMANITLRAQSYDLTRLSDAELSEFERLATLASSPGGDQGRGGETLQ
jgi:hypothetical protein